MLTGLCLVFLIAFCILAPVMRWKRKQSGGPTVSPVKLWVIGGGLCALTVMSSMVVFIPTSTVGVVKTVGKVANQPPIPEGLNFIRPWDNVATVKIGMDVAKVEDSQAASKDLQSVSSDIVVNFYVDPSQAVSLYKLDPTQQYLSTFVLPAVSEIFKSVVARYTAEELVTKRQQVSDSIVMELNARLSQYYLKVRTVNIS